MCLKNTRFGTVLYLLLRRQFERIYVIAFQMIKILMHICGIILIFNRFFMIKKFRFSHKLSQVYAFLAVTGNQKI